MQYKCTATEGIGGTTTLTWSVGGVDVKTFTRYRGRILENADDRPGVSANLTEVTLSGFTSILVIESAGVSVADQTVIQCQGQGNREKFPNMTLHVTDRDTSVCAVSVIIMLACTQTNFAFMYRH